MSTDLKWKGVAEFAAALDGIVVRLDHTAGEPFAAATQHVAASSAAQFGKPPAPTSRSGKLAGAVTLGEVRKVGFGVYEAAVGPSGLAYVRVQSLGKKPPRPKPAHPWFPAGVRAAVPELPKVFIDAWRRAIHGV